MYECLVIFNVDYEWVKCPWMPCNFPKNNLAKKVPVLQLNTLKKSMCHFFMCKKVNVPWHIHRSRITHKYCEVPKVEVKQEARNTYEDAVSSGNSALRKQR